MSETELPDRVRRAFADHGSFEPAGEAGAWTSETTAFDGEVRAEPAADGTYTAPIGELIAEMSALTTDEEAFVELILSDMPPRPANYEDIIATNLGQNPVDDEEAFTLELGPNNCAASQDSLAGD